MRSKEAIIGYLFELIELKKKHESDISTVDWECKDIQNLINELKKDEESELKPILNKLVEQRRLIIEDMVSRNKDYVVSSKLKPSEIMKFLNKNAPEEMARLFFIDIQLENLGYKHDDE